jgi:hypothetical protein
MGIPMNHMNVAFFSKTEADLRELVEPLASYISATREPPAVLVLALTILFNDMHDIGDAANAYLAGHTRGTSADSLVARGSCQ